MIESGGFALKALRAIIEVGADQYGLAALR